ncbi:hypothetical protein [Agrobacterium salinitolerans]|uniref:Uncharacterized protein n=1 Tax=Agrobacterium salinitolerans TaxID=1183413 RepID=A0A9X3KK77_9HYPH|nr:hypothetical protein [Agrobacterium salinitolerans]MCZ7936333.1 hypothetical protein [Agrobacterium salinitolerans]
MSSIGFRYVFNAESASQGKTKFDIIYFAQSKLLRPIQSMNMNDVLSAVHGDDLKAFIQAMFYELQELMALAFESGLESEIQFAFERDILFGLQIHWIDVKTNQVSTFRSVAQIEDELVQSYQINRLQQANQNDVHESTIPGL